MIVGTGIDIAEVPRIAQALARHGDRFLHRVFTEGEIRYCDSKANRVERYAARFAAKEAFFKAMGTGWMNGTAYNEIEIMNQENGKPELTLLGETAKLVEKMEFSKILVSMSHLKSIASAIVIIEK